MRIISYNLNGIRAAIKKGFMDWLATSPADVVCIQETKATENDIDVTALEKLGYHHYWFSAQKKGYSSVAIFSKTKPDNIIYGTGHAMSDSEGRVIQAFFGDVCLINAYFPSGTSGDERQAYKYVWLNEMQGYVNKLKKKHPKLILVGDYNIAHKEIDIHDPKGNKNSSGFLPDEREWMDDFLSSGWVDSFRAKNDAGHNYSWWSQRFPSVRLNNKGWRIDYICVTTNLEKAIKQAAILPDVKHSDHCPVYAEIKF
jgi:exodeoxyribonuclease III